MCKVKPTSVYVYSKWAEYRDPVNVHDLTIEFSFIYDPDLLFSSKTNLYTFVLSHSNHQDIFASVLPNQLHLNKPPS